MLDMFDISHFQASHYKNQQNMESAFREVQLCFFWCFTNFKKAKMGLVFHNSKNVDLTLSVNVLSAQKNNDQLLLNLLFRFIVICKNWFIVCSRPMTTFCICCSFNSLLFTKLIWYKWMLNYPQPGTYYILHRLLLRMIIKFSKDRWMLLYSLQFSW